MDPIMPTAQLWFDDILVTKATLLTVAFDALYRAPHVLLSKARLKHAIPPSCDIHSVNNTPISVFENKTAFNVNSAT